MSAIASTIQTDKEKSDTHDTLPVGDPTQQAAVSASRVSVSLSYMKENIYASGFSLLYCPVILS